MQSAIYERNLEMTRLLLDAHADYEYTSTFGANALMYLWYPEDPCTASAAFLSMFSNVGIKFDLDLYDTQGFSALELAVASGDAEAVKGVLKLGATSFDTPAYSSPSVQDAMAYAIKDGRGDIVELLLPAFGNIDGPLSDGWRLIEKAAYRGQSAVLRTLLRAGSDEFCFCAPYFPNLLEPETSDSNELTYDAWDVPRCRDYIDALVEHGRVVVDLDVDASGVHFVDIFWEASEIPI